MSETRPTTERVEDVTEQVEKMKTRESDEQSKSQTSPAQTAPASAAATQAPAGPRFLTLPQMTAVVAGICAQNNIVLQSDDLSFFRNMAIVSTLNDEHERGVPVGSANISTEAQILIRPERVEELARMYFTYRNIFTRYRS